MLCVPNTHTLYVWVFVSALLYSIHHAFLLSTHIHLIACTQLYASVLANKHQIESDEELNRLTSWSTGLTESEKSTVVDTCKEAMTATNYITADGIDTTEQAQYKIPLDQLFLSEASPAAAIQVEETLKLQEIELSERRQKATDHDVQLQQQKQQQLLQQQQQNAAKQQQQQQQQP